MLRCIEVPLFSQMAVKNCFIRGSVVRYVQLPAEHVDTQLLEDATRRGPSISNFLPYIKLMFWEQRRRTRSSGNSTNRECLTLDATAVTWGHWGCGEDRGTVIRLLFNTSHRKQTGNCILDRLVDQGITTIGKMNVKRVTRDQAFPRRSPRRVFKHESRTG